VTFIYLTYLFIYLFIYFAEEEFLTLIFKKYIIPLFFKEFPPLKAYTVAYTPISEKKFHQLLAIFKFKPHKNIKIDIDSEIEIWCI